MCVPSESCCPYLSVILCKYTYKLPAHSDPKEALFVSIVCVCVWDWEEGGSVDGKYSETQMSVGDKESVACVFLHFTFTHPPLHWHCLIASEIMGLNLLV